MCSFKCQHGISHRCLQISKVSMYRPKTKLFITDADASATLAMSLTPEAQSIPKPCPPMDPAIHPSIHPSFMCLPTQESDHPSNHTRTHLPIHPSVHTSMAEHTTTNQEQANADSQCQQWISKTKEHTPDIPMTVIPHASSIYTSSQPSNKWLMSILVCQELCKEPKRSLHTNTQIIYHAFLNFWNLFNSSFILFYFQNIPWICCFP